MVDGREERLAFARTVLQAKMDAATCLPLDEVESMLNEMIAIRNVVAERICDV